MTPPAVPARHWEGASTEDWIRRWRIPDLRIYEETGSTNQTARDLALNGAPAGTTVIANHQWAGRGREGRTWHDSPGHSLLLSVVLRPRHPRTADALGPVPLRVGLAVCAAIERCCALDIRLKWPNDVLAPDGRKIAGILCETASGTAGSFVVAGIGTNVLQPDSAWLDPLEGFATSIQAAMGRTTARADLAGAILDALRPFDTGDTEFDRDELLEFQRRDALMGRPITLDGQPAGTARGIRPDGTLIVDSSGGRIHVRAGTVRIHPEPTGGPLAETGSIPPKRGTP